MLGVARRQKEGEGFEQIVFKVGRQTQYGRDVRPVFQIVEWLARIFGVVQTAGNHTVVFANRDACLQQCGDAEIFAYGKAVARPDDDIGKVRFAFGQIAADGQLVAVTKSAIVVYQAVVKAFGLTVALFERYFQRVAGFQHARRAVCYAYFARNV